MELSNNPKIQVTYFHRKPRSVGNYSVEFIFEDVRNRLKNFTENRVVFSTYQSSGFLKRLYNALEAASNQGKINHVTGDINYLGIFLNKKKTIQTILDCVHVNSTSGFKQSILKYFWLTLPVKRCSFVTAISNSTKNEILKFVHCDPDKIVVIPVAISDKFRRIDKAFNEKQPRILQLGTAPNKNIPRLLEAIKDLPCSIDIVGKHVPEYEYLLKSYSIKYTYEWGLTEAEIHKKYEEADLVSLVSTYEGFGMPILEAQTVGRPVITSNLYSMPEVAGEAAYLVNPYDIEEIRRGIETIINDAAYRKELVDRGFQNINRFNPDLIANEYLKLYRKLHEHQ